MCVSILVFFSAIFLQMQMQQKQVQQQQMQVKMQEQVQQDPTQALLEHRKRQLTEFYLSRDPSKV